MAEMCFKTAAVAIKEGGDVQERRMFKQGTELERVANSTSFPLCCCAGTVAGFAAGSWINLLQITTDATHMDASHAVAHLRWRRSNGGSSNSNGLDSGIALGMENYITASKAS